MWSEQQKVTQVKNEREGKFGAGREAITTNFKGYKMVAVGNTLHFSKSWQTFPDFLMGFLPTVLGKEWGNQEIAKSFSERHPILQGHVKFLGVNSSCHRLVKS